jgi:hypothetical protein
MTAGTTVLTTFLLLWLAVLQVPGANSLMVAHSALTRPMPHVAWAIRRIVAGVLLLAAAAMLGWSAALGAYPWLRHAIHALGGAYLIYFGLRLSTRARLGTGPVPDNETRSTATPTEPRKAVVLGFVIWRVSAANIKSRARPHVAGGDMSRFRACRQRRLQDTVDWPYFGTAGERYGHQYTSDHPHSAPGLGRWRVLRPRTLVLIAWSGVWTPPILDEWM